MNLKSQGGKYGNALIAACQAQHKDTALMLLENGAIVNALHPTEHVTALYTAASFGHAEVVQLLLKMGANTDSELGVSTSALEAAAGGGHEDVVNLLLRNGAEIDSWRWPGRKAPGISALYKAAKGGHEGVVKLLLQCDSIDINSKEIDRRSPLIEASSLGHTSVVQLLLPRRVKLELMDLSGNTALMNAVQGATRRLYVCSSSKVRRHPLGTVPGRGLWILLSLGEMTR